MWLDLNVEQNNIRGKKSKNKIYSNKHKIIKFAWFKFVAKKKI